MFWSDCYRRLVNIIQTDSRMSLCDGWVEVWLSVTATSINFLEIVIIESSLLE